MDYYLMIYMVFFIITFSLCWKYLESKSHKNSKKDNLNKIEDLKIEFDLMLNGKLSRKFFE
jgi:hypothetical protein